MKLTTKGRYAVTAMLDLALNQRGGVVTVADIAQRQQISVAYLEQLFGRLRRYGLVESVRGPGGGYRLAMPDSEIPLTHIVEAVNESISTTQCGGDPQQCCKGDGQQCLTHDLWEELGGRIAQFLGGITLGQLVEQQLSKESAQVVPIRMMDKTSVHSTHKTA
ncbi:MAG: Rrf2 family transcriptional regulator [Acidithiobacillus ferriphilus]|jgi:transcriptional regulator, BadM/Rrf2 family|uniref:DNA-binding protein n=3 Tax=Acidithiobacillus TaxID=119977 RepID=A0A179BJ01_ACIFR|nr:MULTISPECIES: Rrf2 family transcriptional regulator [Acidithiobacillus]OYV82944.1 MAG: DNA-binding protein [Acidithiobacillus ferrivorans]MBU2784884.1 Rrf2 family transcriptional regulator [Acidithiobacillus ferriphilus]MBU2827905.1 Rrf2 family transcriptional regulator [Acidithiobacillus ferriphilus]MBU2830060.1 Rrf2 family transcriptional regulator [Acidithiobacillus ferriphilus]MBU2831720.1 Rrf2 family transcriptional regulator [Acidithiobacillus ferriphilus]